MRFTLLLALLSLPLSMLAQSNDSTRAVQLQEATVSAIRADAVNPIPYYQTSAPSISRGYFGQELPVLLSRTPSIISQTDAGLPFGYAYYRLRGMDQTRLNVTIDGIPLNEPEDQGAYFSNLPGFASMTSSLQIQRGTGTSTNGAAAFGGSLNFTTVRSENPGSRAVAEFTRGAYNSTRGGLGLGTGRTESGFSAYARGNYQSSDGYRHNAFNRSGSCFGTIAYTGKRTVVRLIGMVGDTRNGMAWMGSTREQIANDPRHNPLTPEEKDHFAQQLAGLSISTVLPGGGIWSTTVYGIHLRGVYTARFDSATVPAFNLRSNWGGLISTFHQSVGRLQLDAGIHALTYQRTHWLVNEQETWYSNQGRKQEASTFAKVTLPPPLGGQSLR